MTCIPESQLQVHKTTELASALALVVDGWLLTRWPEAATE